MINWVHIFVIALAAARVTRMFVQEHGPGNLFGILRELSGADKRPMKPGSLGEWWNCPWCMSVTWSVIFYVEYIVAPEVTLLISIPLAMSMVAGWAMRVSSR